MKASKHDSLLEKSQVLAKWMSFRAFSRNEPLFAAKFIKTWKHDSLLEKLQVLAKWIIFRVFSRNEVIFGNSSSKLRQNAETL